MFAALPSTCGTPYRRERDEQHDSPSRTVYAGSMVSIGGIEEVLTGDGDEIVRVRTIADIEIEHRKSGGSPRWDSLIRNV
jgi:hypothetical protein